MKYQSDKAIECIGQDELNRRSFAQNFAKAIIDLRTNDTFTIGLFGEWGSGKTSIINMTEEELKKHQKDHDDEIIICRFEPWHFDNSTQLISQFLVWLGNIFESRRKKVLKNIGKALIKYSDAFELANLIPNPAVGMAVSKIGGAVSKGVGEFLSADHESKDILQQKKGVVELLEKAKKRVLIIIDDIDRLSNEQIRQVFQLISAVAKFPNTMYLVAFDKKIVVKALEKVQEGSGDDYLKKIVQMPIQVPNVQGYQIHSILDSRLMYVLNNHSETIFYKEHWSRVYDSCVRPFIKNIRDINLLCNMLEFKLSNVASEINFADMAALSAIEIKEPGIYEWIKENKNNLVGNGYAFLNNEDRMNQRKQYRKEIEEIISKSEIIEYELKNRVDNVMSALSTLFPFFEKVVNENLFYTVPLKGRKYCLVCHQDKFDRYFNMSIDDIAVKKSAVNKVLFVADENEIVDILKQHKSPYCAYEMLAEIEAHLDDLEGDRAKILIKGLMNSVDAFKNVYSDLSTWIDLQTQMENLAYKSLNRIEAQSKKAFILDLISNASIADIEFVARFIKLMQGDYNRFKTEVSARSGFSHMVSLTEFREIEQNFVNKCRQLFSGVSIFTLTSWYSTLYVWGELDSAYVENYMASQLKYDRAVIVYLKMIVTEFHGTKQIDYEILKEPYKYITKQRIAEILDRMIENKELFKMNIYDQRRAVAVYLGFKKMENNDDCDVSQEEVDEWIASNQ